MFSLDSKTKTLIGNKNPKDHETKCKNTINNQSVTTLKVIDDIVWNRSNSL